MRSDSGTDQVDVVVSTLVERKQQDVTDWKVQVPCGTLAETLNVSQLICTFIPESKIGLQNCESMVLLHSFVNR